jgi:fucose permease
MGLGAWWGAPIFTASALAGLILFQQTLPLNIAFEVVKGSKPLTKLPRFFLWFPLAAFLYGATEGTFGNWITIYLEEDIALSATQAALGLALYWAMITLGRVLFAFYALHHNPNPFYRVVPVAVAGACLVLPLLTGTATSFIGIVIIGLALSSFFPYTISLASNRYPEHTGLVSGALMASLMLGTGLNTNLVGFLRADLGLPLIFQITALYGLVMAVAAWVIQQDRGRQTQNG